LENLPSSSRRFFSSRRLRAAALAGRLADHQAAAVQHADELQQIVKGDLLRGEFALELVLDVLQARAAVEHAEDRVLLFVKAEVVEPDRLLHHPERPAVIAVPARRQIGPHPQRERTRGAADQAFGQRGHGAAEGLGEG
jgi:hypothetical protein